jgi:long-subunit fatty acid transport protein
MVHHVTNRRFFLSEIGTPDLGLASAGSAARAQDASTVFTNPAGMTRLDETQLMVGVEAHLRAFSIHSQQSNQFGNLGIGINSAKPHSATANLRYQDTFDVAIGTQIRVSDQLMLSTGFDFDNSMVSSPSRSVSAPLGNQWRYGVGAQYALNKAR